MVNLIPGSGGDEHLHPVVLELEDGIAPPLNC
jgi:hypothetical protein